MESEFSWLLLALPLAVCVQVIVRELLIHDLLDRWPLRPSEP